MEEFYAYPTPRSLFSIVEVIVSFEPGRETKVRRKEGSAHEELDERSLRSADDFVEVSIVEVDHVRC